MFSGDSEPGSQHRVTAISRDQNHSGQSSPKSKKDLPQLRGLIGESGALRNPRLREKTECAPPSHLEDESLLFGFSSPQSAVGKASQSHPKPTRRFSLKEDYAVVIARRAFLTGNRKIDFVHRIVPESHTPFNLWLTGKLEEHVSKDKLRCNDLRWEPKIHSGSALHV